MDSLGVLAAILAWLLILGVALLRIPGVGLRALAGPWLVLTFVSMGCVFMAFFVISYGLLFLFGREAAAAGVVSVRLARHVLRVETAALAACACR